MKLRYISIYFVFLSLFCFLAVSQDNYTVEFNMKSHQTLESLIEEIPFIKVNSINENIVTAEIQSKHLNLLKTGKFDFKVLLAPKSNYLSQLIPKNTGNANPIIQSLINLVSSDTIRHYILALQNFGTRYEYTPQQDSAGVFIYNQFVRWGLQTEYDTYKFGTSILYDLDFINADTGWIVGTGGLIVSTTNSGQNWFSGNSNTSLELYGIDMINSSIGWVVGQSGLIRKTTNGGTTWFAQTSGVTTSLFDVSFINDQLGLIVGASGRILRTTNSGIDWSIISSGTTQTLREVNFVSNLRAWVVGTNGTILITTNGGLNWSHQSLTPSTTNYLRAVCFLDTLNGFAVGDGKSIYKTTNGGTNWLQKPAPPNIGNTLRGVSFKDLINGWIVDFDGNILRTTDGGENWSVQYSRLGWAVRLINLKFTPPNNLTSIGRYGNIITSTDGGFNWVRQTYNLPAQFLHTSSNVVATIPGTLFPEKEVIIVAHYDSYSNNPYVSAPGANDNATGTVAVMEAARLCKDLRFENTVKFIAVSAEELGMIGSDHYAFKARDEGRNIIAVINSDMIGYPTTSDTSRLIAGSYSIYNRLIDSAIIYNQRYNIGLNLVPVIDNSGASDYGPFALAGYDALHIAEATAEEIWGGADPYYHTMQDTYDKLKPSLIRKGTQLKLALAAEFGKVITLGKISGSVYNDLNRDSSIVGDSPLPNWVIKLYKDDSLQKRTTTNSFGNYSFVDLEPGTYTIEESLKVDWVQTIPRVDSPGVSFVTYGENAGPRAYIVDVHYYSNITDKDFGNYYIGQVTNLYSVSAGWNMISVPVTPLSWLKTDLFPSATSPAYWYRNEYLVKDTLEFGKCYWLKFPSAQTVEITGFNTTCDTIDVKRGWNMIGSISIPVQLSNIRSLPAGIISSNFFFYDRGYIISDVINPGCGYWVKVNQDGQLILSTSK